MMGDQRKEQLLNALRTERAQWETLLTGLDEAQITAPTLDGGRSIKDVIAHLTAWQRLTRARLEAATHGTAPQPPEWPAGWSEEHDLDRINEWFFTTYREKSLDEVLREWRHVFQQVLTLGEALPEQDLDDPRRFAWLNGAPLSAVLEGSYEHYDEHYESLRQHLGQTKR
jgi:hypothetical protein